MAGATTVLYDVVKRQCETTGPLVVLMSGMARHSTRHADMIDVFSPEVRLPKYEGNL